VLDPPAANLVVVESAGQTEAVRGDLGVDVVEVEPDVADPQSLDVRGPEDLARPSFQGEERPPEAVGVAAQPLEEQLAAAAGRGQRAAWFGFETSQRIQRAPVLDQHSSVGHRYRLVEAEDGVVAEGADRLPAHRAE